jgi:hypothetical protein
MWRLYIAPRWNRGLWWPGGETVAPRARGSSEDKDPGQELDAGAQSASAAPDETSAIAEALAQLGADERAYILVHKADAAAATKGWAYCARYQVGHFDLDAVRDQFGAGRYKAVIVRSNGKHFRQIEFLIAAPAFSLAAPATPAVHLQGHQAAGAAPSSLIEQLILKSMEGTQTMLAAMVTALVGGGGGVKGADLVAAFREGREATGGQNSTIEAIKLGVELGGSGPAGEMDPLLAVAGPLMGLLQQALNRPQGITARPAQHVLPGRTSTPAPTHSAPPLTPPAPINTPAAGKDSAAAAAGVPGPFIALARQWLPVMLKEARSGRDGYTWGHYMAERVKEAFRPHLEMLAEADAAERMQLLTSFEPSFAEHADWVDEAAEGILDVLKPQDDDNADEDLHADPGSTSADGPAGGGASGDGNGTHDAGPHPAPGSVADREGARGAD